MTQINKVLKLDMLTYAIDENVEKALLNGTYAIKRYRNQHPNLEDLVDNFETIYHCKQIYVEGNILYKTDEPKIDEMLDLMVLCTYDKKAIPAAADTSIRSKEQMLGGTICPTKEVLFKFEGKIYVLYGRYIFGYDHPLVKFVKCDDVGKDDGPSKHREEYVDDHDIVYEPKLSIEEIIIPTLTYRENATLLNDYNFAFKIFDEATGVLDAFAIYR